MVGLGLIVVIVVVLLIVFRPGAPAADQAAKPGTGTETTAPAEEPSMKEGDPCTSEVVSVTAVTDKNQYAAGEQPMISMSILNNSAVACILNVGTTQQLFTITSGAETYWKSTDCQSAPIDLDQVLEPGVAKTTTPIPWDRTRSNPDTCEGDRSPVPAGGASYHLNVQMGDIKSEETAQFLLN